MNEKQIVRVKDVMKTEFDMINGLATITDALKTMKHVETKCLIVEKRHEDDEYGILLLADIARKVLSKNLSPDRVNVYEVMAKPIMSVDPKMDIKYCARIFDRFNISRAPVIENRKVIGIISFTDMVLKGFYRNIT